MILVGPPRLTFKKPVVLRFGHCANLKLGSWELGVYHCDSLYFAPANADPNDDAPWVKLATIGQESESNGPILAHMDFGSCCIMTDFLSRFCIVGQSGVDGIGACKVLRLMVFAKLSSSSDLNVSLVVVDDTKAAVEKATRLAEKAGFGLADKPKSLYFHDGGDDMVVSAGECSTGWSLNPRSQQVLDFDQIWSMGNSNLRANYKLRHVDPTVETVAFNISVFQPSRLDSRQAFTVSLDSRLRQGFRTNGSSGNRSVIIVKFDELDDQFVQISGPKQIHP